MKLKHHKDFPKEEEFTLAHKGCWTTKGHLRGFNECRDICGEIEVLEKLDEEKIRQSLIRDEACLKLCRHFTGQIIHKKFGISKGGVR